MSVVDGKRRSRRRVFLTGSPQMPQNGITAAAHGPRSLAEAPARPPTGPQTPSPAGPRRRVGCPNLPQRPRSNRSAREETLIFRASAHRRSRPGAPLWQIWTHPAPNHPTNPTSTTQNLDTPRITFTARVGQSQCTYRCVALPDDTQDNAWAACMASQCTYRCVVLPDPPRGRCSS